MRRRSVSDPAPPEDMSYPAKTSIMVVQLNKGAGKPVYLQIVDQIKAGAAAGTLRSSTQRICGAGLPWLHRATLRGAASRHTRLSAPSLINSQIHGSSPYDAARYACSLENGAKRSVTWHAPSVQVTPSK